MLYLLFRREDPMGIPSFDVVKAEKSSDLSNCEGSILAKVIEAETREEMLVQVRRIITAYVYSKTGTGFPFEDKLAEPGIQSKEILQLRTISKPSEYGEMCRLAREIEDVNDEEIAPYGDLWNYLQYLKFDPVFIESIAKVFWKTACNVISSIPYSYQIFGAGCRSQRKLMVHFLREVCHMISVE